MCRLTVFLFAQVNESAALQTEITQRWQANRQGAKRHASEETTDTALNRKNSLRPSNRGKRANDGLHVPKKTL
ncbi:hypothetical protein NPIL_69151 [Nephila pilipes]|uniref:Uncharacterized protein n=1 Tax=Nephila pilipes TaxID=299642 RepID=A0A8X6QET2_NEPPI|nr:hypothetical protein NPIL_69151 [Nephila pilipes]